MAEPVMEIEIKPAHGDQLHYSIRHAVFNGVPGIFLVRKLRRHGASSEKPLAAQATEQHTFIASADEMAAYLQRDELFQEHQADFERLRAAACAMLKDAPIEPDSPPQAEPSPPH